MPKERIYDLRLDIKKPDVPFAIERSIGVQSGDLVQVFAKFQIELIKLLKELHQEEILEIRMENDDIPF